MKLSELFGRAGLDYPPEAGDLEISKIVTDSRNATPGCLFICMTGRHSDGHGFAVDAIHSGASVIVAEQVRDECVGGAAAWIMLKNTRQAAALLYNAWYHNPAESLKIIGVTGTNGKTSVCFLLCEMLERWGKKCGLIGTVRCRSANGKTVFFPNRNPTANMTTPDPEDLYAMLAQMVSDGVEYVVMEVTSHALALYKTDAIQFSWGVFTNLTQDHLDFHGDMEQYYQAKKRLFSMSRRAVLCRDDPAADRLMREISCSFFTCSLQKGDFCALEVRSLGADGMRYRLQTPTGSYPMEVRIPGRFSVMNALEASAVALAEGMPAELVSEVLKNTRGVEGRMERVFLGVDAEVSVFIDYAHTPDAMEQLLKTLLPLRRGGRLLVLFGCGGERDRSKRAQMGRIASAYADELIVTSDNSRGEPVSQILRDILKGVNREKPCEVIADRRQAIRRGIQIARSGDILVLAGKGHEHYEINQYGRSPFDERRIVTEAWQEKKGLSIQEERLLGKEEKDEGKGRL